MSRVKRSRKPSVGRAFKMCLRAIESGRADWRIYFRLAELLSACGYLEWSRDNHHSDGRAESRFDRALECLDQAEELIFDDAHDRDVSLATVICCRALTLTRKARLAGYGQLLELVQPLHDRCASLVLPHSEHNRIAHHLLAVSESYGLMPFFGEHFGFRNRPPNYRELYRRANRAEKLFACESWNSIDGERDRRWLWFQLAVAYFEDDDDHTNGREKAEQALWNALWHRDWEHVIRALAILAFGMRGERFHRWLRYLQVRDV